MKLSLFPRITRPAILAGLVIVAASRGLSADYYVAMGGDDNDPGTLAEPFATIQHAADLAGPGTTIFIRGGTYHEIVTLSDVSGTATDPITFTAYEDEEVVMDGTIPITGAWSLHGGSIYKTTLAEDIWQLFDDGEMMIPARWPNAFLHDDSIWDQDGRWALGDPVLGTNGTQIDSAHNGHDLAATGLDMTGAMGVMNVGSFKTWPRLVTAHTPGSNTFTYNLVPASGYRSKHQYYYLEGKLNLLDAEREWFYDQPTKTLYLRAVGSGLPTGDLRGKNQAYAFNIDNCDYLVLDGLKFFATTFHFDNASYCTIRNCTLDYPSYSRRMLGSEADIELTRLFAQNNGHPGNTLRNCVIRHSDGQAVELKGVGCVVENNEMRRIDFSCAGLPGLGVTVRINGTGAIIRRNRIDTTAHSSTFTPGFAATTELNRISNTGFLQSDGACIHRTVGEAPNSISRYNWIHDTVKFTIRFDGDPGGQQGLVHHNVTWSTGTMRLKGDLHQIYNNLGLDSSHNKGDINIALDKGGNPNSITRNNAASTITDNPIPGTESNNYDASEQPHTMRTLLRDPDNLDFRPQATAVELVDQGAVVAGITDGFAGTAPDIGAYEYSATDYWIAGRQLDTASTPIPPDLATGVKTDADLIWLPGLEATTHRVYFSTNPAALTFLGEVSNNIVSPGPMVPGSTGHWRIDTVTPTGVLTGEQWSFTVDPAAATPAFTAIESWRLSHFGTAAGSGDAADSADPDGDLLTNSAEYVLGSDPLSRNPSSPAAITPTFGGIEFSFTATAASGDGYAGLTRYYDLESTPDLANPTWLPVPGHTDIVGAGQLVTITLSPAETSRFYRLRVRVD